MFLKILLKFKLIRKKKFGILKFELEMSHFIGNPIFRKKYIQKIGEFANKFERLHSFIDRF